MTLIPIYPDANLVPVMTSSTTPEGEALEYPPYNWRSVSYLPFQAFNPSTSGWVSAGANVREDKLLAYKFAQQELITSFAIIPSPEYESPTAWLYQASNDGITWVNLGTFTVLRSSWTQGVQSVFTLNNTTKYLYHRLKITDYLENPDFLVGIKQLLLIGPDSSQDPISWYNDDVIPPPPREIKNVLTQIVTGDKIKIRPMNYKGIVTSYTNICYFHQVKDAERKTYIVSLDKPNKNRLFEIRERDILTIYDAFTNEVVYQHNPEEAL